MRPLATGHAADLVGLRAALLVPAACYGGIAAFGVYARRPWQPRMGDGQDFNPMVRVTAPGGDVAPEPTLEQIEEQSE